MVKLQLAASTIAKSRSQIRPKPVKDLPINTIFIFSMAGASRRRRIFIAHSWNVEVIIKMHGVCLKACMIELERGGNEIERGNEVKFES